MLTRISDLDRANVECGICHGYGWVCENHQDKAWAGLMDPEEVRMAGKFACECGAGAPCKCNPLSKVRR